MVQTSAKGHSLREHVRSGHETGALIIPPLRFSPVTTFLPSLLVIDELIKFNINFLQKNVIPNLSLYRQMLNMLTKMGNVGSCHTLELVIKN